MFYEPKKGIPFKIDPFKSLVFPRPIGWISSINKNGIPYCHYLTIYELYLIKYAIRSFI